MFIPLWVPAPQHLKPHCGEKSLEKFGLESHGTNLPADSKYSLVQWSWFSDVTGSMQLRCFQWRQRVSLAAPGCTKLIHSVESPSAFYIVYVVCSAFMETHRRTPHLPHDCLSRRTHQKVRQVSAVRWFFSLLHFAQRFSKSFTAKEENREVLLYVGIDWITLENAHTLRALSHTKYPYREYVWALFHTEASPYEAATNSTESFVSRQKKKCIYHSNTYVTTYVGPNAHAKPIFTFVVRKQRT